MKKWLAFILLLITFASTFYPCCVYDNCDEEEIAASSQQKENPEPEGNCSPFFACQSCPGFTINTNIVSVKQVEFATQVHNEKHVASNLSSYTSSFWQPPRVC